MGVQVGSDAAGQVQRGLSGLIDGDGRCLPVVFPVAAVMTGGVIEIAVFLVDIA